MTITTQGHTLTVDQSQVAGRLFDWLAGPVRWSLLGAGLELKLFDHLATPIGSRSLARLAGLCEDTLLPWLRGLAAMGVLEQHAQGWVLTPELSPFLLSTGTGSLAPTLLHLEKLRHGSVSEMVSRLRHGSKRHAPPPLHADTFWQQAAHNLESFHQALAAPLSADLLSHLPFWQQTRSILDVGAGSDVLSRRLLNKHSDLTVTLFDLPGCIDQMKHNRPLPEALFHRRGDYNQDALGTGYDLAWCAMSLYYAKDLVTVCQRIRQALNSGGWMVSLHEGFTGNRTQPELHVISRTWPAMRGADVSFNAGDIARAMTEAEFCQVTRRRVAMPWGDMELTFGQRN